MNRYIYVPAWVRHLHLLVCFGPSIWLGLAERSWLTGVTAFAATVALCLLLIILGALLLHQAPDDEDHVAPFSDSYIWLFVLAGPAASLTVAFFLSR